jgi:hypothetical protein
MIRYRGAPPLCFGVVAQGRQIGLMVEIVDMAKQFSPLADEARR